MSLDAALAQATVAWQRFDAWAAPLEKQIALAAHPGFPYDARPTTGWPLTRLSQALAISGGYLLLVLVGVLLRKPAQPAEKAVGVLEGIRREPIKLLQIVYNAVQARGHLRRGRRGVFWAAPAGRPKAPPESPDSVRRHPALNPTCRWFSAPG
jgi:hypothetical protein